MYPTEDVFSRLTALRPRLDAAGSRPESGLPAGAEKLMRLLEGENRSNRMGSHVLVKSRFPQPLAGELDAQALRLIHNSSAETLRDPQQWLFLDTETTGLAGGTGTYAFLVGIAWWENDGFAVEQYFMRDYSEEASMLWGLMESFSRRSVLVTFNGKSFDWPLLQTRFQMRRLKMDFSPAVHLDLLHPARRLWRLCCGSVALVQLEKRVLGFNRGSDIPSETIPRRYFDFLRGGQPEEIVEVFQHNRMDLCGLAFLALHMLRMLSDPEKCAGRPEELYGVSRLLHMRGEEQSASRMYQRALEIGLPREVEPAARRELALLAKRARNYELSNAQWEKLLCDPAEWFRAYEQLAIYYEHYGRLTRKAAALSRAALVRLQEEFRSGRVPPNQYIRYHQSLQHRLSRLSARLAREGQLP